MNPLFSRLVMAVLFISTIGMAVWRMPPSGYAGDTPKLFFPLISTDVPGNLDPDFYNYVGVGVSDADGDVEVYTVRGDSSDLRQLTHNTVTDLYPSFSPNGAQIVFTRELPIAGTAETLYQVVVVGRDGSGERVVWEVRRPNSYFYATWSPRGQHLLVMNDGTPIQAWVVGLDGAVQPFAANPVDLYTAQWSPDGRYISYRSGTADALKLYVTPVATGVPVVMGDNVVGTWWTPDSREILFANGESEGIRAVVVQPDGSGEREVLNGDYYIHGWVRNGQHIVAQATTDIDQNFYLIPRGGGTPLSLTNAGDSVVSGFMDEAGIGILYEQRGRGTNPADLYWMPLDTRIPRFISEKDRLVTLGAPFISQNHNRLLYTIFDCFYRYCGTTSYEVHLDDADSAPKIVPQNVYRYLPNSSNRSAVQHGGYPGYYINTIEMVQLEPSTVTPVQFTAARRVRIMAEWRYLP